MYLQQLQAKPEFGKFGRHVLLPMAAVVAAAIILVLAFALFTASKQNAIAIVDSTRLAKTALLVKEREIARNLKDYAIWEDAYQNLHVKLNTEWASTDGNVGANIKNSLGYDMAFVVNPERKTVYAVVDGKPQTADAISLLSEKLAGLFDTSSREEEPIVSLLGTDAGPVMVAITAILPPAETAERPPPEGRSLLIFAKMIDGTFLQTMGERYLLKNLKLEHAAPASLASLPLSGRDGQVLGYLNWEADRPGDALLRTLLPPLAIAFLGLAAFAALVLANARRSAKAIEVSARTIEAYAQTLEKSEARFRDVAEASSDWIWETDPEFRFAYLSGRFNEVTGVAAAAVLGKSLDEFFSSDPSTTGWAQLREETQKRTTFRDVRCQYRDSTGTNRICRLAGRPIVSHEGTFCGFRGTATDITPEVEAHARANHLALHDVLTELPNRILLRERLNLALSAVKRDQVQVAVLCLDLDHFKEVNDTLGHGPGDTLLKQMAARLQAIVRSTDTVSRLGGDEFAIVQVSLEQPHDAHNLARRLIEEANKPFQIDGHELYVGASIGVAVAPTDGDDQEQLLRSADIALYRAKQAGRGTYRFFESQMDSDLQARKALEHDLRQALLKGELEVHYQPLVTLEPEEVTGVEALLRWNHPERGPIAPVNFIPIAEDTGLIIPIGEWVLRKACAQAVKWPQLRMAVNISPVQFKHRELIETVKSALADSQLEPSRLELEITESVLLYDTKAALEILTTLKGLGVRIAMDDFGTGYSSLGYLNRFPFDKIKIDQSFITNLNEKNKSDAIVRSVIGLGQSLNMVTTAEGVETLEQLAFLLAEGCQQVQGYYFGHPMPPDQLSVFLERWLPAKSAA